ncbi:MAG: SDR family oxidoreductase [Deltaproteobacteria bacterium]|nr:SDR family oxidoreductase [Deltaproteobacteria bacterium]
MTSEQKLAVITGGSSGLGLALSKRLAAQGYLPLMIARNGERLQQAHQSLKALGYESITFSGDVTHPRDLEEISEQIQARWKKIDCLVLNAGVVHVGLVSGDHSPHSLDEMKQDIETNLWGAILTAQYFVPLLPPGSKILIISSALGLLGLAGYSAYCAAKAGLIHFAESLRRELLHRKIQVYVACPADIDTPQFRSEQSQMPEWMKQNQGIRSKVLSPDTAASRILKKCQGDHFLITINFDVSLLAFLSRILPRSVKDFLIDHLFPRPKSDRVG